MAYRAGEKLTDERTGLTHDFTKKEGVVYTEILSKLDTELDRSKVWNLAEKSENRKDARTAREWVIALPDELDEEQRKELAKEFAQSLVDRYGVIADLAIHAPSQNGSDKNHHAHILLTTRKAELDTENKLVLTQKSEIELSNTKRKSLGIGTSQEEIKQIRATWANLANHALEYAGYRERIDHRSYADQGNQLQATIHEGSKVTQMRRKGIDTEISRFNDTIKQQNSQQLQYKQQHKEQTLEQGFNRVEKGFEQWKKDQEAKRLELEHKKQLKLQQEQAMKLKQRKSMNRNGPSL